MKADTNFRIEATLANKMLTPTRLTFSVAALTLFLAGCHAPGGDTAAAKPSAAPGATADATQTPVNVVLATDQDVVRLVPVTGSITALQSLTLMPKVTANVLTVAGREGDTVHAGEVVVSLDPTDYVTQLRQAEANLQDARAKLTQARTNYTLQLTMSETGVQNAQAALNAAKANLAIAKQPQRDEQVRQSSIAVEQAQANYDKAVSDHKRYQSLYDANAVSASDLETYATAEKVQKANLDNAKQNLQISTTGGRAEDIRASEEQVREATIALQLAKSNVQQNAVRLDDVKSAEAAVAQNEANVAYNKQQVSYCTITSPIDGVISARTAEPGTLAGPGAMTFSTGAASSSGGSGSVMTLVALGTVYYQAQVPETDIAAVRPGRTVSVQVDAYPGKVFTGTVAGLFPTASTTSRNFNVRINIPNADHLLRPGMFARGNVVAERHRGIVVPKDAVINTGNGEDYAVFVVDSGNKAVRRAVKVGIQTSETSEILSGIASGDQVIVAGQDGLHDGSAVRIEQVPGASRTAQGTSNGGPKTPHQEASAG